MSGEAVRHWRQDDSTATRFQPRDMFSRAEDSEQCLGLHSINKTSADDTDDWAVALSSGQKADQCESLGHSSRRMHSDQKEWRRGQRLPSPPSNKIREKAHLHGRENRRHQVENKPTHFDGAERKRATFSAAPSNAWGVVMTSSKTSVKNQSDTASNNIRTKTESSAEMESKALTNNISFSQYSTPKQPEPAKSKNNPWGKKETVTPRIPNETIFPSLESNSEKSKLPNAALSSKAELKTTAPLSLPTTSLWGKSQKVSKTKLSQHKVDLAERGDFPSLLTASAAPRSITQQQISQTSSDPASFGKEKGAKKQAPNLASFISPKLSGSKNKGVTNNRSKQNSSIKTITAVKKKNSGVKRSITPSMPATSSGKLQGFHPFMINDQGAPVTKKGRQRLTPKKKKLTTLKKRVLEERLRVWKERNEANLSDDNKQHKLIDKNGQGDVISQLGENREARGSSTILIENFVRPSEDDLTDEDEYDEITSNVVSLAGRVGKVASVFVPRPLSSSKLELFKDELSQNIASLEATYAGFSFVKFSSCDAAIAGRDILDGIIVGGEKIRVSLLNVEVATHTDDDRIWQWAVLQCMSKRSNLINSQNEADRTIEVIDVDPSPSNTITFHNILTDDDYKDDEALTESLDDISSLARQYGEISNARPSKCGSDQGNVYISYKDNSAAAIAVEQLNGILIGGSHVLVTIQNDSPHFQRPKTVNEVLIENVLDENDFEDDDCLDESIKDISNIARRYGVIGRVYVEKIGDYKGRVHIEYVQDEKYAQHAAHQLNGMIIGGSTVRATIYSPVQNEELTVVDNRSLNEQEAPSPMYSGDKIIPERFAACKRVPKIPNSGPRSYAVKINDDRAVPLLAEMLGELMRLQERSKDDKNARARRRLVMGLREVARGIRAHKVKMVVMANNLDDEYGAIDTKLQEILEIACTEDVPVVFEFNKRKLGKAVGKSIKVSVVGIQSADGAQEQFKKLKKIIGVA